MANDKIFLKAKNTVLCFKQNSIRYSTRNLHLISLDPRFHSQNKTPKKIRDKDMPMRTGRDKPTLLPSLPMATVINTPKRKHIVLYKSQRGVRTIFLYFFNSYITLQVKQITGQYHRLDVYLFIKVYARDTNP